MKLIVSPAAVADLERLYKFLAVIDAALARRAMAAIEGAVQSLYDFPRRGRPSDIAGMRELIVPFGRAAYVLRYMYSPERQTIVVLRVWHSREERE